MHKILIVDDEPLLRNAIGSLEDWASMGYDLSLQAGNGQMALDILAKQKVSLVLCDIMMPEMDGLSFLERFNALKYTQPVIMLSAYNDFESVRKAFKLGAKDYLIKSNLDSRTLLQLFSSILSPLESPAGYCMAISNAIEFIKRHYCEDISLKTVSQFSELSESYFSKLFSKEVGISYVDYLLHIRVENAERLLRTTNMKIYQVAEHVGFNSVEHFCRMFKRINGKTPNSFKNEKTIG